MEIKPDKMFMDLAVLNVLTRALLENINDFSGQKPTKYREKLMDLFRRVVAAKPSFIQAWRLYAKVVAANREGNAFIFLYH